MNSHACEHDGEIFTSGLDLWIRPWFLIIRRKFYISNPLYIGSSREQIDSSENKVYETMPCSLSLLSFSPSLHPFLPLSASLSLSLSRSDFRSMQYVSK